MYGNVIIFCPRGLGITQQSIQQAARQIGLTSDLEIIEHATNAIERLTSELRWRERVESIMDREI